MTEPYFATNTGVPPTSPYPTNPVAKATPEQKEKNVKSFNKKLALDLQRILRLKKPDITAAFVLGTLHTWKKSRRYPNMSRVLGAVYQSVEGICEDLPLIDRSTVLRAIRRLEKAFTKDFTVSRDSTKVLNFEISDKLTKEYFTKNSASKNNGSVELSLDVTDAQNYGVVEALLIRNLEFKTRADKVTNPLRDEHGRIYGELNSSKLSKTTRSAGGSNSTPILPFGRQRVNEAISTLRQYGVIVEHKERRGFYRVERVQSAEKEPGNIRANRQSPNATVVSSNATKLAPNATVYSEQIVRDRSKIESVNKTTELSPAARSVAASNFDQPNFEASIKFYPAPDIVVELAATRAKSATVSFGGKISRPEPSEKPINLPLFFKDGFPELMRKVEEEVQQLRNALKKPIEPVHPDLLPFDLIIDPEMHLWIENELFLNPLTDMPIDWSNFDEQIDIAVDELSIESFFDSPPRKQDVLEFREHFKRYEGLSVPMVRKMLASISDAMIEPTQAPLRDHQFDHQHFARKIKNLRIFNRYFRQLFRETFAPFINDNGEFRFEEGQRLRWWPNGEKYSNGEFAYPLCESPETMPEPFRTILKNDVEKERAQLPCLEASQITQQDVQDNGEMMIHPSDQDLLTDDKMDAFLRAKQETMAKANRSKPRAELLPMAGTNLSANGCVAGNGTMSSDETENFPAFSAGWWLTKELLKPVHSLKKDNFKIADRRFT